MDELAIDYKKLLHNKILEYAETHDNKLKDDSDILNELMYMYMKVSNVNILFT